MTTETNDLSVMPGETPAPENPATDRGPVFFPVSVPKLLLMSLCTLGLYQVYWLYKNWRFLKDHRGAEISPWARSIFGLLFCYSLFNRIRTSAEAAGIKVSVPAGLLTFAWILTTVAWQFHAPYTLLGFLSFLCLVPPQIAINQLNAGQTDSAILNTRYSGANITAMVIGLPFQLLAVLGLSGFVHSVPQQPVEKPTVAEELRQKADEGDPHAMVRLGAMYQNGDGLPKNYGLAMRWYRRAANTGFAGAELNLGLMYANGQGVQTDNAEAVTWMRKAADQGLDVAENDLGIMYQHGWGVVQNSAQAADWFRKSAEQGYAEAQAALGLLYEKGEGVPHDEALAHQWLTKAADKGNESAKKALQKQGELPKPQ